MSSPNTPGAAEPVTVVIPAHNEVGAIASVVEGVFAHTPGLAEIVVVDDGSTDGTAEAAARAGARVITLSPNRGKGLALRRGIDEAATDLLLFIDGDAQDDPAEIPRLLDAMTADTALVIGSRFIGTFDEGAITRLNFVGSRVLATTLNVLFGARVTDPFAGFRAVRKSALDTCTITAERYDIEVDVVIALLQGGHRVVEVPVSRYARPHGTTGLSSFRDGTRILWRILARRASIGT